ncbi:FAD-dependent oxidoreductase, partial [Klebsiella aerogenes]|uniref:FAD-dependent oxidoreductase n=1 Tax=Klebsiella aerogenes TaxID=548 RepID=UPI001954A798
RFRYGSAVSDVIAAGGRVTAVRLADGERIEADAVIATADVAALAGGLLGSDAARTAAAIPGKARSLSAMTWSCVATARGFPLLRHSV